MTRRERLERKAEKRRQWAESRQKDATARFEAARQAVEHIPFGQPILVGHHSERRHRADLARHDRNMDKACESLDMAKHHEQKADGLEAQLETCIFSDDDNAIEAIEAKLATLEAKRERMKTINSAHKRFLKNPASLDAADLTEEEKAAVRNYKPTYSWTPHPFPPYVFQNLGANIRRYKGRIEEIKRRTARTARAEANGGMTIEKSGNAGEWSRVTFADKPDREIINSLKAAGFYWSAGSWHGLAEKLPECVKAEKFCGEQVLCPDDTIEPCVLAPGHGGFHDAGVR